MGTKKGRIMAKWRHSRGILMYPTCQVSRPRRAF